MKPLLRYALALVIAVTGLSATSVAQVCHITGTVYQVDGKTPAPGATLTVSRADKSGKLFTNTKPMLVKANSVGVVSFYAPRTVGTDSAYIKVGADFGNLASGQILYVPSDTSATLETMVTGIKYNSVVVIVPSGGNADTVGTTNRPEMTRIESDIKTVRDIANGKGDSDSLQQAQADAKLALNVSAGKAGADSVHAALLTLSNLIAGKASADSIHTQLLTVYNLVAGKAGADSVHSAIAAMLKMSDTTALHAQRFAVINDSIYAIGSRATTALNTITAHAVRTDNPHSVTAAQTGALALADTSALHAQKFAVIDTALSKRVITESDPTATAKAQVVVRDTVSAKWPYNGKMLVNGNVDSLNSTGRIYVSDDSITFTVSPSDVVNCALGNVFRGTIGRNDTLSLSNMVDGQIVSVAVTNAGTYTLAWSGVNWAGGTPPPLSVTANKRDVFTFIRTGGIIYGSAVQDLR